jgi:hypothetical protein
MSKGTRIQFRVTEAKKKRFSDCADKVRMKDTALGEAAVDALCDYIESHGEITMPLAVIPESVLKKLQAAFPHVASSHFPSTARAPHGATPSLNEEPAKRDAVPPIPLATRMTRTRAALRNLPPVTEPKKKSAS